MAIIINVIHASLHRFPPKWSVIARANLVRPIPARRPPHVLMLSRFGSRDKLLLSNEHTESSYNDALLINCLGALIGSDHDVAGYYSQRLQQPVDVCYGKKYVALREKAMPYKDASSTM